MQQLGESRMWTGNCLRDSGERSSNEARAAYLARASTCVIFRAVLRVLEPVPLVSLLLLLTPIVPRA